MARFAALAGLLAAAFAVFYLSARTPTPDLSTAARPGAFCTACAVADIAAISRVPHPPGTPAQALVRDRLVARMQAMGLAPRIQRADSLAVYRFGPDTVAAVGPVENIIGVLPGRDRAAPALALMAHYDSVPGSPGAADDATGAADALEITRVLKSQGIPARDVMIVLTDGEEAGLLGARAFFGSDPAARRIGFVINLETRGGGGRANMFETGADDGEAVGLYARTAWRPTGNAIFPFVYRYLPNDTDFTVARKRGVQGLNFAFIGRQFDYHSPSSTLANLDLGSVEHMGRTALGPARALAFDAHLPARAPDVVFGDILGLVAPTYDTTWGWAPLGLTAAFIILAEWQAARQERLSARAAALGAAAGILGAVSAAALLFLARASTGVGSGWLDYRPILARFPLFEVAMTAVALAGLLLGPALLGARDRVASGWIGALVVALVLGIALQATAPLTAFAISWPLLAAAACAAATAGGRRTTPPGWIAYAVIAAPALAWIMGMAHALLQGLDAAPAIAAPAWLASLLLWPLAAPARPRTGAALVPALVFLACGLALCLWLRVSDPWTPRHPRAVEPIVVVGPDGTAQVASLAPDDDWTRRVLGPGPHVSREVLGAPGRLIAARASPVPARQGVSEGVSVSHAADALDLGGPAILPGETLVIDLRSNAPMRQVTIAGHQVAALDRPGGGRLRVVLHGPGVARVILRPGDHGSLTGSWALWSPGWPPGSPPLPPLPVTATLWDRAPATVFVGDLRSSF